jgi:hypothetical protein
MRIGGVPKPASRNHVQIAAANYVLWSNEMATVKERITVLVTAKDKSQIVAKAKNEGISMGELLRRAALSYDPSEDEIALEGIANQICKSALRTCSAIDKVIRFVEASNKRIATMERKAAQGRN